MAENDINKSSVLSVGQTDYLQRLKVGLATAIIRIKPPHLSSQDFAKQIALQLNKREDNWKERAAKLEEEVLQMKQKLLLEELRRKETKDGSSKMIDNPCVSPDDWNENEDFAIPTPPDSSEVHCEETRHRDIVMSQTKFLSSTTKLESTMSPASCKFFESNLQDVINKSLQTISSHYKKCLELSSLPQAKRCSTAIVNVLDSSILDGHRQEAVDECISLINIMIKRILTSGQHAKMTLCKSVVELITTLGRSPHLKSLILDVLVKELQHVSEDLRSSVSQQKLPNHGLAENSFYVFQIVDGILTADGNEDEQLEIVTIRKLQEGLENAVLHLTDVFPLFTQYVWKLLGILEFMSVSM